jgi:hypothetical protein
MRLSKGVSFRGGVALWASLQGIGLGWLGVRGRAEAGVGGRGEGIGGFFAVVAYVGTGGEAGGAGRSHRMGAEGGRSRECGHLSGILQLWRGLCRRIGRLFSCVLGAQQCRLRSCSCQGDLRSSRIFVELPWCGWLQQRRPSRGLPVGMNSPRLGDALGESSKSSYLVTCLLFMNRHARKKSKKRHFSRGGRDANSPYESRVGLPSSRAMKRLLHGHTCFFLLYDQSPPD